MNLTSFDRCYLIATVPAVAVGAIYLIPGALDWPQLGLIVTAQIVWLAALTFVHAAKVLGRPGALAFGILSLGLSWLVESNLLRTAVFGSHYEYAEFLGPHLPGGVPCTIPLMWFGLAYLAWLFVSLAAERASLVSQALLCGYLLCVFDLLLDPIATGTGTFVWHEPGAYYTTPLRNFAGWFGVGTAIAGGYCLSQRWPGFSLPAADTTTHQQVAGLLGLVAFVLPAVMAALIGRFGAAILFATALAPAVGCWLVKASPSMRADRELAPVILGSESA